MKKYFLFAITVASLINCNNKKDQKNIEVSKDSITVNESEISIEKIPSQCYSLVNDKDTIYLKMVDNLGTITGNLAYANFVKDQPNGEVMGYASGDTIKLDFILKSKTTETSSTKEIWFLKKDDQLIQTNGKYDANNEKYSNPSTLEFSGNILKPADCKEVEKMLK